MLAMKSDLQVQASLRDALFSDVFHAGVETPAYHQEVATRPKTGFRGFVLVRCTDSSKSHGEFPRPPVFQESLQIGGRVCQLVLDWVPNNNIRVCLPILIYGMGEQDTIATSSGKKEQLFK